MDKKSKMLDAQKDESGSPLPTIVGGRPLEQDRVLRGLPSGVQKLLIAASLDQSFKEELVADPGAAAKKAGMTLTPSELAILLAVPAQQLSTMIDQMYVANPERRSFLEKSAAAALALAAGTALDGCPPKEATPPPPTPPAAPHEQPDHDPSWPPPPGGIQPDRPAAEGGIRADRPPVTRGIRPDRPPRGNER